METKIAEQADSLRPLVSLWERSDFLSQSLNAGDAGVPEPTRPFFVAGLARISNPLLVVTSRSRDAEALAMSLRPWFREGESALFPAWEVLPGEALSPTLDTMGRRIKLLRDLNAGKAKVVVASVRAFLQKVQAPQSDSVVIRVGSQLSQGEVVDRFTEFGFEHNYLVERPGDFAVRGGILDVFPPGRSLPVRADFFGDEVVELKEFSVASQRSGEEVESVEVIAVRELRLTDEVKRLASKLASRNSGDAERAADLDRIASGVIFPGIESYLASVSPDLQRLSSLFEGGRVVIFDPNQVRARSKEFLEQAEQWGGEDTAGLFGDFEQSLGDAETLEVWGFSRGEESPQLEATGWDEFVGHPAQLAESLRQHHLEGASVTVAAGSTAPRAKEMLSEGGLGLPVAVSSVGEAVISTTEVGEGFLLRFDADGPPALALVGTHDLFGRRRPAVRTAETAARATALLLELVSGDYVVHESYGVGRYHGMVTRELSGVTRDYLVISYAAGDRLFLPTEQLEAISKYTGGETPRLNRLGTGEWERTKSRARRAVEDIAGELLMVHAKRNQGEGFEFSADSPWQRELEDSFGFLETPDQSRAIEEVKLDMQRPVPMDRLLCGDVGFGKTEVAVRAAFKAVQDSKQVAVLVPTTILAQQHTQTFRDRFAGFPIRVEQFSRFLTDTQQADVLEGLGAGRVDVVIGTHRLLQPDVKFHDLGLLVVDEEHRFGVKHKETIKKLRAHVDILTMTATPIPRTMEMSLTAIRDMSVIDTAPADRRPVLTYVGEASDRMIQAAIRRELAREGQVFFVHNRVRTIKRAARTIAALVPGARVETAHGQMSESELEHIMVDVWDGKIDVLVCTTIIESGLDIPAMNTLIVERADLLGLAQLYQLRGRVGRARERAYAYLFYPHEAILGDEAHERLKILSEFTELGSGFKVALRDLEIRGAGNLLGAEQSGHISAVGFDLYTKMMGETVKKLSGQQTAPKPTVIVDIPTDAFVPAEYVARESLRMDVYRHIERITSQDDSKALADELVDRYGPLPKPVRNLLTVAEIRALAGEHGISDINIREGILKVRPLSWLAPEQIRQLNERLPAATYKEASETLLVPTPAHEVADWVLQTLRAILA